jgi:hypothetical protein
MLPPKFRTLSLVPVVLVAFAAAAVGYWAAQPLALAASGKDGRLSALLQERLTALREASAATNQGYHAGRESLADVITANQAVRSAELELCGTDKERIAILEKRIAAQQVGLGVVPTSNILKAKVNRLDMEIAMERAKSK